PNGFVNAIGADSFPLPRVARKDPASLVPAPTPPTQRRSEARAWPASGSPSSLALSPDRNIERAATLPKLEHAPSPLASFANAMTQNIYDNPEFFEGYSRLGRSVEGLEGAAEWPALRALLPDLRGLRVVDLGCGFGWF